MLQRRELHRRKKIVQQKCSCASFRDLVSGVVYLKILMILHYFPMNQTEKYSALNGCNFRIAGSPIALGGGKSIREG